MVIETRDGDAAPGTTPYPEQLPLAVREGHPAREYDIAIVGGGPAGLSAAIYASRFNRRAIVFDFGEGRSTSHETNENYLGFPHGVGARELRELGCRQALRYGAEFAEAEVEAIEQRDGIFHIHCADDEWNARAVILATGVVDLFPDIEDIEEYVGRSLFWCITCDGWKTRDRRVAVVGADDDAAITCMQFLNFTPHLSFITNADLGSSTVSDAIRERLSRANIPIHESRIARVNGDGGMMQSVSLADGSCVEAEIMISQQGSRPNSSLASSLGLALSGQGYVLTDVEQRTNVPLVYAAGDLTKAFAHQIVTAAHEGATAATTANYDLYRPEQRHD